MATSQSTGNLEASNSNSSGNGRDMQHDTIVRTLPSVKGCRSFPASQRVDEARSEYTSMVPTVPMRPHNLHSTVVPDGFVNQHTRTLLAYHPITRPRREADHPDCRIVNAANVQPMKRWERGSVRDQAWNGVAGVYGDYVENSQQMGRVCDWSVLVEEGSADENEEDITRADLAAFVGQYGKVSSSNQPQRDQAEVGSGEPPVLAS
jgi:hypothetical protein